MYFMDGSSNLVGISPVNWFFDKSKVELLENVAQNQCGKTSFIPVFEISSVPIPVCDLSHAGNRGPMSQDPKYPSSNINGGLRSSSKYNFSKVSEKVQESKVH